MTSTNNIISLDRGRVTAFTQVPLELFDYDISPAAFKLYVLMLGYVRQAEICWPGYQRLAQQMQLTKRRVIDLVRELEQAELIEVESRAEEGLSNIYRLHLRVNGSQGVKDSAPPDEISCTGGGMKDIAPPDESNSTGGVKNIALPVVQKISPELHVLELHAIKYKHTHKQKIMSVMKLCGGKDPWLEEAAEVGHKAELEKSLEDRLREAGISRHAIPALVRLMLNRGRGKAELERLIRCVEDNPAIENCPAYLVKMIQLDQFPPPGSAPPKTLPARTAGIDFAKYLPGGKYAYLSCENAALPDP
jgi:hypothetical protein